MYTDFVLNPDYEAYVQTNGQTSPKSLYPFPLFTLAGLGLVVATFIAVGGYEARDSSIAYFILAAALAIITIALFVIRFQEFSKQQHLFRAGTLISATLTAIQVNEHSGTQKAFRDLLRTIGSIFETIDVFSNSAPLHTNTSVTQNSRDDFYEIIVMIAATTPSGASLEIIARKNRPDLRGHILPKVGDKLALLYLDDNNYKLM